MVRGVSNPREGSKILFFLFRSPPVGSSAPTFPKLGVHTFSAKLAPYSQNIPAKTMNCREMGA
jgi:hypothetical protein